MATMQARMDEMRQNVEDRVPDFPPESVEKFIRALHESGIVENAVGEGDTAPPFVLPNQNGENVRSRHLLAEGPLVLVFYRGVW